MGSGSQAAGFPLLEMTLSLPRDWRVGLTPLQTQTLYPNRNP